MISPSTSTISTTRVANAVCSASSAASPRARLPKRKFSPTDTHCASSRAISSWSMNSCAVCAMRSPSNGITTSSSTPRPAIRSAFCSSVVSSFGAASGATTVRGCGSNVSTLSAPRDDRAVADVHAVELADRQSARPGRRVGEPGYVHPAAEAYDGLEGGAAARLGEGDQALLVAQAADPGGAAGDGRAVGGLACRVAAELDAGRNASASSSADERLSASATSNSPIRVRRSSTQ